MQRFRKILVPVDVGAENDPALDRAAELAKLFDASITMIDVVDTFPRYADLLELQDAVLAARQQCLDNLAAPFRNNGLNVKTLVVEGAPAYEVTREVLRNGHDLVLRTSRIEGILERVFVGTLAMRLIRVCPGPVWVVQPRHDRPFKRIVAAVNAIPGDVASQALNLRILEFAESVAQRDQAELHVLHAWPDFCEGLLSRRRFDLDEIDPSVVVCAESGAALTALIAQSRLSISDQNVHLVKGPASLAIPHFVTEHNVELLVMGTLSRTGLAGLLIGNTAERVLHQVDCSLLTVKPDGFVTPVILDDG